MRILLVVPSISGEERYGKLARSGTYLPPLGLAYLAAVLEHEHQVKIIDGSVEAISIDGFQKELLAFNPDIVGFSVITSTVHSAFGLCTCVKIFNRAVVTVLGGPHPTARPEEALKNDNVDYVVIGEGESTFKELIDVLASGGEVSRCKGLGYKSNGRVALTPPRERISDLDTVPFPARHLLPLRLYSPSPLNYKKRPAFTIICSRGCPNRCSFCSHSKVFRGRVTMRSVENIIEEIRLLIDPYGAREISLWDDNFGLQKEWTLRFCSQIKPLGIPWSAWMRVDSVDPEILGAMCGSGCWYVSYGVESGDQRVLDTIRKGCTIEHIRNAFKWTHQAGMEARATFILGLPNETRETIRKTVDLAVEIQPDYAQFHLLALYPGTELWDSIEQFGQVLTRDYSKQTGWFPVFVPRGFTTEEIIRAHRRAYRRFYIRPAYLFKRLASLRTVEDVKRNMRGGIDIVRYLLSDERT